MHRQRVQLTTEKKVVQTGDKHPGTRGRRLREGNATGYQNTKKTDLNRLMQTECCVQYKTLNSLTYSEQTEPTDLIDRRAECCVCSLQDILPSRGLRKVSAALKREFGPTVGLSHHNISTTYHVDGEVRNKINFYRTLIKQRYPSSDRPPGFTTATSGL